MVHEGAYWSTCNKLMWPHSLFNTLNFVHHVPMLKDVIFYPWDNRAFLLDPTSSYLSTFLSPYQFYYNTSNMVYTTPSSQSPIGFPTVYTGQALQSFVFYSTRLPIYRLDYITNNLY